MTSKFNIQNTGKVGRVIKGDNLHVVINNGEVASVKQRPPKPQKPPKKGSA